MTGQSTISLLISFNFYSDLRCRGDLSFESHFIQKGDLGKQPITEVAFKILAIYFFFKWLLILDPIGRGGVGIVFIKTSATELKVVAQALSSPMEMVSRLQN